MKICLVCSQGGHLAQTLRLLDAFEGQDIFIVTYFGPRENDVRALAKTYLTRNIGTSFIRMAAAIPWAMWLLIRERPGAIVSMGSEIALPFLYCAWLLGIRSIYIESWSRAETLSMTGRLVYPVVSEFWVQWPQLLKACGSKARFHGAVI